MKKITEKSKMQRNLLKKMIQASDIYAYKALSVTGKKQDTAAAKLQVKSGTSSERNTKMLFNYKADPREEKWVQFPTKGISLRMPAKEGRLEKEKGQSDQSNILKNNLSLGILIIMMMFLISSCALNTSFLNSSVVPAAQGSVKVKTDNNKNYVIQVKITDLADVGRLQPPKESYVVWMETEQGRTEKLGQLLSSKSFLSKQMTADLETVSSFKPVKVFVTAENESSVQYPDNLVVLTTARF